jgi:hypothetical protein
VGERSAIISLFLGSSQDAVESLAPLNVSFSAAVLDSYRKSSTNQADFIFCLDQVTSLVAAAKLPFPQALDGISQWEQQISEARAKGYLIAGLVLPNLAKALETSAARLGELRAAKTALAVERYRLAHGNALPAGLSALVPDYLAAVPVDPFDGKPLRFKKITPKGYMIYSIGRDRQDDGGITQKRDSPGTKYDLVVDVRR